jgi:CHAT domain-containing protein
MEAFLAEQLRLLVAGATDADAVVAAFEQEIDGWDDAFAKAMCRYSFAQWLMEMGLRGHALDQLERSAAFLTQHPDRREGHTALAVVQALQSRCWHVLGAAEALGYARGAVESLCAAHLDEVSSPPHVKIARTLHGTLGEDESILAIVCGRYAGALFQQPRPDRAAVREACRWLALGFECIPDGEMLPLTVLAVAECGEALNYVIAGVDEYGLDGEDLRCVELAERVYGDDAAERLYRGTAPMLERLDPMVLIQSRLSTPNWTLNRQEKEYLAAVLRGLDPAEDPVQAGGCALLLGGSELRAGEVRHATALLIGAWQLLEPSLPPGHPWRLEGRLQAAELMEQSDERDGAAAWTMAAIAEATMSGFPMDLCAPGVMGRLSQLWSDAHPPAALFLGKLALGAAEAFTRPVRELHPMLDEVLTPSGAFVAGVARSLIRTGRLGEAQEVLSWGDALSVTRVMARREEVEPLGRGLSYTELERAQLGRLREVVGGPDADFDAHAGSTLGVLRAVADTFAAEEERHQRQAATLGEQITAWHLGNLPDEPGTTAVIRYLVLDDHMDVLLLTPSGSMSVEVPASEAQINDLAFRFLEQAREPERDEDGAGHRRTGRELFDLLFPEAVQDRLRADGVKRLAIGAMGALRFIPFAALYDGTWYLVERWLLVRLPETYVDLKRHAAWPRSAALLGATFAGAPRYIPAVARELNLIRRILTEAEGPPVELLELRDRDFDAAAVRTALSGAYGVVHVASHFRAMPASASGSFLRLGDGDVLALAEVEEIAGELRDVELAVLSACSTGLPAGRAGVAEWSSPTSLLHARGARALLSTLWQVDDASTSFIIQRFYHALFVEGADKTRALGQAQLALLDRGARGRPVHPFFWAGLELSGNWMPFRP